MRTPAVLLAVDVYFRDQAILQKRHARITDVFPYVIISQLLVLQQRECLSAD
jgi:hypothetical protein